jgi:hypothetical protein
MWGAIKSYFNNCAEQWGEKERFDSGVTALIDAIRKSDSQSVTVLFNGVKESALFTHRISDRLLRESFRTDDKAVFSILFSAEADPNYWFEKDPSSGVGHITNIYRKEHILHAAIEAESRAIALSLAKNKKVAIGDSGEKWIEYPDAPSLVTAFTPPLEFAEEKRMYAVAEVLAKRTAAEYSLRARQDKMKAVQSK